MTKYTKAKPTEADKQRISETIINTDSFNHIKNQKTFDEAYDDYFESNDYWRKTKYLRNDIRDKIFSMRKIKYPIERVEQVKLEEITKKKIKRKYDYKYMGKCKGNIVKVRKTFIKKDNKRYTIYRDRKGRFASVK